jgi:hypothetical protein
MTLDRLKREVQHPFLGERLGQGWLALASLGDFGMSYTNYANRHEFSMEQAKTLRCDVRAGHASLTARHCRNISKNDHVERGKPRKYSGQADTKAHQARILAERTKKD